MSPLLVLLIAVLVAAVGFGGYLGWEFWGSNVVAARAMAHELESVKSDFSAAPAPAEGEEWVVMQPEINEAAWIMRIPKLGGEWPVIAGVDAGDLRRGIGWYPGTSLPGQIGNFAVAGNRVSDGAPLRDVFDLVVGDEIIIETAHATFTYTLISAPGDLTVTASDSWVLDPVPGRSDEIPTHAYLTLTTAEDVINTSDRAVGFGILTTTEAS